MKLSHLCTVIFALSIEMLSQTISITGEVTDAVTKSPLAYANISVINTNYGTVSNQDGKFNLPLDSASYKIVISFIGYESDTLNVNSSDYYDIKLQPISYQMDEVIVSSLTWAEKFILEAIAVKNGQLENLHYYVADAYSKTTFTYDTIGVVGLIEAISEVQFIEPNLYSEKLFSYKVSRNFNSVSYEIFGINQETNLLNNTFKTGSFEIVSPLNDDALEYYRFELKRKTLLDRDTVVIIKVIPQRNGIPLLSGDLYFLLKNHRLIEVDAVGNSYAKNAYMDSLEVYQKYTVKDSLFNLPAFTKFSFVMNVTGLYVGFQQQYTFMNYDINSEKNKPVIIPDKKLVENLSRNISVDSERTAKFNVPLSQEEIEFSNRIDSIFVHAPFYKKAFFTLYSFGFSTLLDQPGEIFGYKYRNFANLYRFNRVEGHYLGLEYQLLNNETTDLYIKGGYAFNLKQPEFVIHFKEKQLIMDFYLKINNLGRFEYLQNINTIDALFYHNDPLHYYKSYGVSIEYYIPVSSRITFTPRLSLSKEEPVGKSTDFSFFYTDKDFMDNFEIPEYNNNKIGFTLSYIENKEYWAIERMIYKGQSFTNVAASIDLLSEDLLNSTEDLYEINLNLVTYQELFHPVTVKIDTDYRHISDTKFINKMGFVNSSQVFLYNTNRLSFHTLENYDYYLQDYFRFTADLTLFNLPEFFFLRPSIGAAYSYLKPMNENKVSNYFNYLTDDFYEYGLALKGLSMFNLYFLKNNFKKDEIFIELNTEF